MLCLYFWFFALKNIRLPVSSKRVVYFQTDFRDVNTDKAANMCKNVFDMEFNITSTKVFLFFSISLSNFVSKCFDYGKEELMVRKWKMFVLGDAIRQYCSAFSVIIVCLLLWSVNSMREEINSILLTILFPVDRTMHDK